MNKNRIEAKITSAKSLLIRVIGNQIFTFEKMSTVLTQFEAVLNSCLLYVLNSDPLDPLVLTPSHVLSTVPLEFPPAADLANNNPI